MNLHIASNENGTNDASARASGSSFYLAMRILPRARRKGMFEIYAFCRCVDDIADSALPRPERLAKLARWRAEIDTLYAGHAPAELRGLAQVIEQFSLSKEDFLAIIAGMEMDAAEDIRAPDWRKLDLYCDRVASAVGRLSVRIFGMHPEEGHRLAHHLGRALQLTNILRDLDEDAAIGRLYLPQEALHAAGISITEPMAVLAHPALARACAPVVDRARTHFAEAETIMACCSRRVVRAPRIMGKVYRAMLDDLVARGWAAPRARVRVSGRKLLRIALQYAFI